MYSKLYMAIELPQETSCAVVRGSNKTTRTDWQAEWWQKLNKNDTINLLQSGTHAVSEDLCPCVCPAGQRSSAGVLDNSHPSDVIINYIKMKAHNSSSSSSSSLHNLRWSERTLPDLCHYVCCVSVCMTSSIRPPLWNSRLCCLYLDLYLDLYLYLWVLFTSVSFALKIPFVLLLSFKCCFFSTLEMLICFI